MSAPRPRLAAVAVLVVASLATLLLAQPTRLPNRPGSLKFLAMGDNGTGDREQYEVGQVMAKMHGTFRFDLVIMLGDNMYGRQRPADFVKKFEQPYAPLLAAGVKFQASLGNHDEPAQVTYRHYNMDGQRYYSFVRGNVRFLALDSTRVDAKQLAWIDTTLRDAREEWKICFFHHPLYSHAARHGSSVDLRVRLEPLFVKHGVDVVFSGHDHVYERIVPQKGIAYFVSGAAGKLRKGNMRRRKDTAAAYDQDRSFMAVEVDGSELFFEAISRTGQTVDSGVIRQTPRESQP